MKLILALSLLVGITLGRQTSPPGKDDSSHRPHRGERIEMMKMWKLTEVLDLSEDQAQKFFPRYNSLARDLEKLGEKQGELMKKVGEMLETGQEVNEKELTKILNETTDIEKQKIDKKRQFFEGLGDVLTPEQMAKYLVFEGRFKRELWKQVRRHGEFRHDRPEPGKKMKRRMWR